MDPLKFAIRFLLYSLAVFVMAVFQSKLLGLDDSLVAKINIVVQVLVPIFLIVFVLLRYDRSGYDTVVKMMIFAIGVVTFLPYAVSFAAEQGLLKQGISFAYGGIVVMAITLAMAYMLAYIVRRFVPKSKLAL